MRQELIGSAPSNERTVIEAMKMETNILAPVSGEIDKIYVNDAQQVKSGELIATLK